MPRKKQNFIPSTYYHLSNIGNTGSEIFTNEDQIDFFIQKFNIHTQGVFTILACCILQNQYHFIVRTRSRKKILKTYAEHKRLHHHIPSLDRNEVSLFLSQIVADICNSYAKAFNKSIGRKGSLFRESFGKRLLENQAEMVMTVKAIERLPFIEQISGISRTWIEPKLEKNEVIRIAMGPLVFSDLAFNSDENQDCTVDDHEVQIVSYAKELLLD
jgi:putative transposase